MNEKALEEIDFFRLRKEIAGFCVSDDGRKSVLSAIPLCDAKEIEARKTLGREWCAYLSVPARQGLHSWECIEGFFPVIKTNGSYLELSQIKTLYDFITCSIQIKNGIRNAAADLPVPALLELSAGIPDLSDCERLISRVITPQGELRELAELVEIRRQISALNAKIKGILQKIVSDPKNQPVLENTVPVLRGGRQVIAVKAGLQNRIKGIVHEVSQSAQTVYVEPEAAVLCANEFLQRQTELEQAIRKILITLTQALQPFIPSLKAAIPVMTRLDVTCAAARWGMEHDCVYPQLRQDEPPLLSKARHPLLGEKAVPIDLRFESEKRVLIVTGPNTGGKTVALKTFALFAMLHQSGFPVPAAEGTRLPIFTDIFADIGDDQSLEQSLSTFSGHMKNLALAVSHADSHSLVLLDELGSGTDPLEGSAIAMAVLDELIKRQAFTLVTTHLGVLKNYGYTNPCCVNASVEFDQDTLSPSYRLVTGIPGESHALDIARKSGIPERLCAAAKNYIATEQADVSALIRGLNKKHAELNERQKQAERAEAEFMQKNGRLSQKEIQLKKLELNLKKQKQQELDDFLIHSRRTLENLVRILKEGEVTREKTLAVRSFISELTAETQRLAEKTEAEEEKLAASEQRLERELSQRKNPAHSVGSNKKTRRKLSNAEALKTAMPAVAAPSSQEPDSETRPLVFEPGASVKARTNGAAGTLVRAEKKGVWQVQFGSVRMSVKEKDLQLCAQKPSAPQKGDVVFESDSGGTAERPAFELRLLGMHSDEAIRALEHQIDLCLLSNFLRFSVIHGKGDGVLQQAVCDYLSHSPNVQHFEFAPAEDGGFGKTYVTLK